MEKEVLGFYLTSHPLAQYEPTLRTYCSHTAQVSSPSSAHRDEVLLGGMLAAIKFSHTKNPRPGSTHTKYAMWDLEDLDGIVRCIMWPEQFAEYGAAGEGRRDPRRSRQDRPPARRRGNQPHRQRADSARRAVRSGSPAA